MNPFGRAQFGTRPNVPFGTGGEQLFCEQMFIVYVLKSSDGRFYKGVTGNLSRRLIEHRAGLTRTTRNMRDIEVVYKEVYANFPEARKREVYLKSSAGRRFLKKLLS